MHLLGFGNSQRAGFSKRGRRFRPSEMCAICASKSRAKTVVFVRDRLLKVPYEVRILPVKEHRAVFVAGLRKATLVFAFRLPPALPLLTLAEDL